MSEKISGVDEFPNDIEIPVKKCFCGKDIEREGTTENEYHFTCDDGHFSYAIDKTDQTKVVGIHMDMSDSNPNPSNSTGEADKELIMFLGRVTWQKKEVDTIKLDHIDIFIKFMEDPLDWIEQITFVQ